MGVCPKCGREHKRSKTGPCPTCYMRAYRAGAGRERTKAANSTYQRSKRGKATRKQWRQKTEAGRRWTIIHGGNVPDDIRELRRAVARLERALAIATQRARVSGAGQ